MPTADKDNAAIDDGDEDDNDGDDNDDDDWLYCCAFFLRLILASFRDGTDFALPLL